MAPIGDLSRDVRVIATNLFQNTNSEVDARCKVEKDALSSINGRLTSEFVF
jgi:hypothetical protein